MGRDSGAIAAYSTLASRDVNICLIPESPFEIEGPNGLCETVCRRLKSKSHCLIVVAEGADEAALDIKLETDEVDQLGRAKHADIGVYLKDRIVSYGKEKYGMEITLKYIDPTYAIRSVPADAGDTVLCTHLAQNCVHTAMAGYTGFSIGHLKEADAIIPIKCLNESAKRRVDINDRTWQRVLASTGQPQMVSPENYQKILDKSEASDQEYNAKLQALIDYQQYATTVIKEALEEDGVDMKDDL